MKHEIGTSLTGCALPFVWGAERMSSSSIYFNGMTFDANFEIIKTSNFEMDLLREIMDVLGCIDMD